MLYLDNNATTIMPPEVCNAMMRWCNRGNASAGYASAAESRAMMTALRSRVGELCNVGICCAEDRDSRSNQSAARADPSMYKCIFVSGASEANATMLQSVVDAYAETTGELPHVVMSAIEHKSLLDHAASLQARGKIALDLVKPTHSGHITPESVSVAITPTTCIVCVMHANNETGAINDIRAIGAVAHKRNVVFHCDTVQTFGKFPINPVRDNVDSFCVSFHKLHGPPGVGVLMIKQQLLLGYKLSPLIYGSQNEGTRGGTENLPGIGASAAALEYTMTDRSRKNSHVYKMRKRAQAELAARIPACDYTDYIARTAAKVPAIELVFLSGVGADYLPGTLLLSVVTHTRARVCNAKIKAALERAGVVVSVGSACNTANPKASHVLYAMDADDKIRAGALRVSFGDDITSEGVSRFVREFITVVAEHTSALDTKKK